MLDQSVLAQSLRVVVLMYGLGEMLHSSLRPNLAVGVSKGLFLLTWWTPCIVCRNHQVIQGDGSVEPVSFVDDLHVVQRVVVRGGGHVGCVG
jgi:hypothetical protein